MTDAETALWHQLRNRTFSGAKFRRQCPIGPYVVDFACLACRLVIELDGGQHDANGHDLPRTRFLEARGYRVLRFWNNDVLQRQDQVLAVVFDFLQAAAMVPGSDASR